MVGLRSTGQLMKRNCVFIPEPGMVILEGIRDLSYQLFSPVTVQKWKQAQKRRVSWSVVPSVNKIRIRCVCFQAYLVLSSFVPWSLLCWSTRVCLSMFQAIRPFIFFSPL